MGTNSYGSLFSSLQSIIRKFYPKYSIQIPEDINGPVVYISHHQNLFGPFVIMLWFPKCLHAWILHVFLDQKSCYKQYTEYTFTKRFGWNQYLAKILIWPISYFISALLKSGKGIPVYRGSKKILKTFQISVNELVKGGSIVIFPDIDYRDSSSNTKELYDGFLYLEKYYYRASGQHICFVPLYVSKKQHLLFSNKQFSFRDGVNFNDERKVIIHKIQENLNELAEKCGDTIH